jgi:hypothetical protein
VQKLFISYARENKPDIDQLVEHLDELACQTWVDSSRSGGQDWWEQILDRITDCDVFIATVSDEVLNSVACKREFDWAEELRKPVLPVALQRPPLALPVRFSRRQIVDYSDPANRDRAALKLAGGLAALPPAPPLPEPLPDAPAAPLLYLTELVEVVSAEDPLDHDQQREILFRLEAALRSVDPEERRSGRVVLDRFSIRPDLFAGVYSSMLSLVIPSDQPAPVTTKRDLENLGRGKAAAAPSTPRMPSSGHGIFISYRRGNENFFARLLYDNLRSHFGSDQVFVDVNSIELGVDFAEVVDQQLSQCSVMLVIIGKGWPSVVGIDGRPRLEDPNDFVRIEVEKGLSRDDVRVIPIYVDGASPPRAQELPAPLAALSRRNGLGVTHEAFNSDFDRLLKTLERVISDDP